MPGIMGVLSVGMAVICHGSEVMLRRCRSTLLTQERIEQTGEGPGQLQGGAQH